LLLLYELWFAGVGDFSEGLASFETWKWPNGPNFAQTGVYGFIDRPALINFLCNQYSHPSAHASANTLSEAKASTCEVASMSGLPSNPRLSIDQDQHRHPNRV
jgi:hypothetical protein